ncbi:DNA internalization-related competence protein ComEC/Rec2 [Collinsella aerofaciens]|uniref:DNA internalization-related competence protein ComEC/Rec2 n=1 Tax=Collinsella aerofaciens TaxID=74426 RepID=A0A6N9JIR9_9ACTN|nr:DNA internalization-related competence protein ComEC/Rec2 [Collinsella aerofaciens]MZJ39263.1 DNA internalization-related competence protein ComEC/Rec2 [Collinsella aerofaciens]
MSATERERVMPPRPLLPWTMALCTGMCMSCALVLNVAADALLRERAPAVGLLWAIPVAAAVFVVLAQSCARLAPLKRWLYAASVGLVAGAVVSAWWAVGALSASKALDGRAASGLEFIVQGDPSINDDVYSYTCEARADGKNLATVRLSCDRELKVGAHVRVIGRVSRFENDAYGRSRVLRGEVRKVKAVRIVSADEGSPGPLLRLRNGLLAFIAPATDPARALIAGVVCGRSSELRAQPAGDWFSVTGTAHLIAVSGSHLAIVGFVIESALQKTRLSRGLQRGLLMLALIAYAVFTGASPSAVRACCMVAATLVANGAGRRRHGLSALFLTMAIFVLLRPTVLFEMGFELSCASVFAILCFCPYATYALGELGMPSGVASVLSVTLCSQLATLPVTIPAFGTFSLIAPLTNAVIGPVISVLLASSVVLAPCSLVPLLSHGTIVVPMIVARCALFFEQLFAAVPGASVSVPPDTPLVYVVPFALAVLLVWWPRPRARSMAAGLVCLMLAAGVPYIYWDRCAPPSVTVLDVGQADAILVRQGGTVALVDCGLDERVVSALVRNNVHHIDAVFVTHWDEDHWGGLPDVLDRFSVGTIAVAADALDGAPAEVLNRPGVTYRQVARGDTVDIGAFRARVMWPFDTVDGEGNEDSLVLLLSYAQEGKSLRVLLTGDAELDQEREFVQEVGDIDVLKLGHHGSKVSVDTDLLETLKPELSIASAGEGNRYGHPTDACIDAVRDAGGAFACTIEQGDITVSPTVTGFAMRCQRP